MRPQPRRPPLVFDLRRLRGNQVPRGKERRDGIRKEDFSDHAIGLELGQTPFAVEIAVVVRSSQVVKRVEEAARPLVVLVEITRLEVAAVGRHVGTGMAVRRNNQITRGVLRRRLPLTAVNV